MQELIITNRNELQALVVDAVNSCLDYRTSPHGTSNAVEIISQDELCERLDISKPTAIRMEKRGEIPSIRLGSNIRYNWYAVVDALEKKGGRR